MRKTKDDLYNIAYKSICDYIYANGKAEKGTSNILWETYPVCIKDKCVDGIALIPVIQITKDAAPVLKLVPYNKNKDGSKINPFYNKPLDPNEDITSLKTTRTITAKLLNGVLEDLKRSDLYKKKSK